MDQLNKSMQQNQALKDSISGFKKKGQTSMSTIMKNDQTYRSQSNVFDQSKHAQQISQLKKKSQDYRTKYQKLSNQNKSILDQKNYELQQYQRKIKQKDMQLQQKMNQLERQRRQKQRIQNQNRTYIQKSRVDQGGRGASNIKTTGLDYKTGQFSRFAVSQQRNIHSMQNYIQKIVQQATISVIKKMQSIVNQSKELNTAAQTYQTQLCTIVGKKNLFLALQDPKTFFVKQFGIKWSKISQMIENYHKFMTKAKFLAVIDGKIQLKSQLKFEQQMSHRNQVIIPTSKQDIYIKIGAGKIPVQVVMNQNQFIQKQDALKFSPKTRNIVKNMVKLFLAEKGILGNQKQFDQKAQSAINQVQQQNKIKLIG